MVTVWGNASLENLNRLQILQNRALKIIYRLPTLTPTLELFKLHCNEILPVKGLQIYILCKFIRESLTNSTYHTLSFLPQTGSSRLRDPDKLARTQPLTGWGLFRLSFQGPTFYNGIPRNIISKPIY